MRPRVIAAALLLSLGSLTVLGLSSCTSTRLPEPAPTTNSSTAAGPQLLGESPGVTGSTDTPANISNDAAKRAHVTLDTCTATDDGWQAEGTISNPTTSTSRYLITVFFSNTSGTVVGWSQTVTQATNEDHARWTAAAVFVAPSATICTIVGVS